MSSNLRSYDTNLVILRNAFAFSNATIPVSTNYQLVVSGPNGFTQFQDSMKILSNYPGVGYLPAEFSTFSGQLADLSTLNATIASKYITSCQLASTTQTLLGEIYSTPNAFASSAATVQSAAVSTAALFARFYVSGVISTVDLFSTQTSLMSTVSGFNTANLSTLLTYSNFYLTQGQLTTAQYGQISANMYGLSTYNSQQYSTLSELLAQELPRQTALDQGLKVANQALSNRYAQLEADYAGVSSYYTTNPPSTIQLSSFSTLVGSQFTVQGAALVALTRDISALSHALLTQTTTKAQLSSLSATFAFYESVLPTEQTIIDLSNQIAAQTERISSLSSYVLNYIPPRSALEAIQAAANVLSAPFTVAEFSTLSTTLGVENNEISAFAGNTRSIYESNSITPQYTLAGFSSRGNRYFAGDDASGATITSYGGAEFKYVHSSDKILLAATGSSTNGGFPTNTLYYFEGSIPRRNIASAMIRATGFYTTEMADFDYGYLNSVPTWIAGAASQPFKRSPDGKSWTNIPVVSSQPTNPKCILAPKLNYKEWRIVSQEPSGPKLYTTTNFINYDSQDIGSDTTFTITTADSVGNTVIVGDTTGKLHIYNDGSWTIDDLNNYFIYINTIRYVSEKAVWVVSGSCISTENAIFWSYDASTWIKSVFSGSSLVGQSVLVSWTGVQWLVITGLQLSIFNTSFFGSVFISYDLYNWATPIQIGINYVVPNASTKRSLTTFNYKKTTTAEVAVSTFTSQLSSFYADYTINNISSGHISSLSTSFGEVPVKGDLNQTQLNSTVRGIYANPIMVPPLTVSSQMTIGGTNYPLNVSWRPATGTTINAPSGLNLTAPIVSLPNMNVYKSPMYIAQTPSQISYSVDLTAWQTGTSTIRGVDGLKAAGPSGEFYAIQGGSVLKSVDGILWQIDASAGTFQALSAIEADTSQGVVVAGSKAGVLAISRLQNGVWRDMGVKPQMSEISVLAYNSAQDLWVAGGLNTSGRPAIYHTADISSGPWTPGSIPPGKPTYIITRSVPRSSAASWLIGTDQTASPIQTSTYFSTDGKTWAVCNDAYIRPTGLATSLSRWVASGHILLKNNGTQNITAFAHSTDGRSWSAATSGADNLRGLCVEYSPWSDSWFGFAEDAVYLGNYYFMSSPDGINWSRGQKVFEPVARLAVFRSNSYDSKVSIYDTLRVAGNLVKSSGYFEIEHPLQPALGLRHSFVEGPTRGDNMYRYKITTVAGGAEIELPAYYPYLNEDPMIWLTAEDGPAPATAKYDRHTNRIQISSKVPNATLNVLVVATRRDVAAKQAFEGRGGVEFTRYPKTQ
jgi:hypothetical protein